MKKKVIERLARFGLIAKGVVYILLGALAFMAAFRLGGASVDEANQSNVFVELKQRSGGTSLLIRPFGCCSITKKVVTSNNN